MTDIYKTFLLFGYTMVTRNGNNNARLKRHLIVDQETYELVIYDCIEFYLKLHPEMEGRKISQRHIITQMARYWLKD